MMPVKTMVALVTSLAVIFVGSAERPAFAEGGDTGSCAGRTAGLQTAGFVFQNGTSFRLRINDISGALEQIQNRPCNGSIVGRGGILDLELYKKPSDTFVHIRFAVLNDTDRVVGSTVFVIAVGYDVLNARYSMSADGRAEWGIVRVFVANDPNGNAPQIVMRNL